MWLADWRLIDQINDWAARFHRRLDEGVPYIDMHLEDAGGVQGGLLDA